MAMTTTQTSPTTVRYYWDTSAGPAYQGWYAEALDADGNTVD